MSAVMLRQPAKSFETTAKIGGIDITAQYNSMTDNYLVQLFTKHFKSNSKF